MLDMMVKDIAKESCMNQRRFPHEKSMEYKTYIMYKTNVDVICKLCNTGNESENDAHLWLQSVIKCTIVLQIIRTTYTEI